MFLAIGALASQLTSTPASASPARNPAGLAASDLTAMLAAVHHATE